MFLGLTLESVRTDMAILAEPAAKEKACCRVHLTGRTGGVTCCGQHGVNQDNKAFVNVLGKLFVVEHRSFVLGRLVPLNKDFAYSYSWRQLSHGLLKDIT